MLRVGGVFCLVLSGVLAVLLFARVRTLRLEGRFWNHGSPPLHFRVDVGPGTPTLHAWDTPPALPIGTGSDDSMRVVGLAFLPEDCADLDAALREIPQEGRAAVAHRWMELPSLGLAFGSTVIESQGRVYVCERSPAAFFWSLGLAAAVPVLCWIPFAIGAFLLRKPPPPPLYGDDGLVEVRR